MTDEEVLVVCRHCAEVIFELELDEGLAWCHGATGTPFAMRADGRDVDHVAAPKRIFARQDPSRPPL